MGLYSYEFTNFLQLASEKGIENKSVCMMGKQDILIHRSDMPSIAHRFNVPFNEEIYERIKTHRPTDSFDFFKMYGFTDVHAIDISPYEGADILFDLTADLPEELYHRFDYIIDSGTLEHTFDCAKSLKNMSNMVKKGGCIFHFIPTAGFVDHGFYSFSPSVFLEFYSANGFQVRDLRLKFTVSTDQKDEQLCIYSPDYRLLSGDINEYINTIYKIGPPKTVVYCTAEKVADGDSNIYPIQGMFQHIHEYWDNLGSFLKEHRGQRVAFYGTIGILFEMILRELYKNNMQNCIKFIFDSDPDRIGTSHRGYQVVFPTKEVIDAVDIILVTDPIHEKEAYSILSSFGENSINKIFKFSK